MAQRGATTGRVVPIALVLALLFMSIGYTPLVASAGAASSLELADSSNRLALGPAGVDGPQPRFAFGRLNQQVATGVEPINQNLPPNTNPVSLCPPRTPVASTESPLQALLQAASANVQAAVMAAGDLVDSGVCGSGVSGESFREPGEERGDDDEAR